MAYCHARMPQRDVIASSGIRIANVFQVYSASAATTSSRLPASHHPPRTSRARTSKGWMRSTMVLCPAVAVRAVLGHHDFDDLAQPAGKIAVHMVGGDQRLFEVLAHHLGRRRPFERDLAGDHVIERRPERVDVRPEVDVHLAADL